MRRARERDAQQPLADAAPRTVGADDQGDFGLAGR
jgi:hypothetical protein